MKKTVSAGFYIFLGLILILKLIVILIIFTGVISITNEFEMLNISAILIMILKFLKNDLIVFSSFMLLYLFSGFVKKRYWTIIVKIFLALIIGFYIFDLVLIYFSTRFFLVDIPKFIFDIPDIRMIYGLLSGCALLYFVYHFCRKIRLEIKVQYLFYMSIFFVVLYFVPIHMSANYLKEGLFSKNIYQLNLDLSYLKKYSQTSQNVNEYLQDFSYFTGSSNKQNVILLVVESLSCVDSYRCSGLKNYMPKYDMLQKEGVTYTNFISTANTTDGGLISLLEGVEAIPFSINTDFYSIFHPALQTLPDFFNDIGYSTTFLTTGPLDFLQKGSFLKKIGFKKIIGGEEFANYPKYTFWSAPDEALYSRGLSYISSALSGDKPFFLTMLTISSHLTYDTPYGKSKEQMYNYVDDKLYDFYFDLKNTKFFDNGILIIIGDHRKMTPMELGEFDRYSDAAYGKISATIIGKGFEPDTFDNNIYQQTDLFFSLKKYFSTNKVKLINNYNDVFDKQVRRNYGLTPMFSDRNNLILIKHTGADLIKLNADKSSIITSEQNIEVLDYLRKIRSYQFFMNENGK